MFLFVNPDFSALRFFRDKRTPAKLPDAQYGHRHVNFFFHDRKGSNFPWELWRFSIFGKPGVYDLFSDVHRGHLFFLYPGVIAE
jgi:hypothetical protein